MKGFITFHEIPVVIFLMTFFHRRLIMKGEAGRYLAAMRALFHYNHTTSDINHFPQV
jgi:hypothetical protein